MRSSISRRTLRAVGADGDIDFRRVGGLATFLAAELNIARIGDDGDAVIHFQAVDPVGDLTGDFDRQVLTLIGQCDRHGREYWSQRRSGVVRDRGLVERPGQETKLQHTGTENTAHPEAQRRPADVIAHQARRQRRQIDTDKGIFFALNNIANE